MTRRPVAQNPRVLQAVRWRDWAHDKVPTIAAVAAYLALAYRPWSLNTLVDVLVFAFVVAPASSAAGYLINDLGDRELDRRHDKPNAFASLGPRRASGLLVGSSLMMFAAGTRFAERPGFAIGLGVFVLATLAYSLNPPRLKERGVLGIGVSAIAQWTLPVYLAYAALGVPWGREGWLFLLIVSVRGATNELAHQRLDLTRDASTRTRTLAVRLGAPRVERLFCIALWLDRIAIGGLVGLTAEVLLSTGGPAAWLAAALGAALAIGVLAGSRHTTMPGDPYNGSRNMADRLMFDLVPHLLVPLAVLAALTLQSPTFAIALMVFLVWRLAPTTLWDGGEATWWLAALGRVHERMTRDGPRVGVVRGDAGQLARNALALVFLNGIQRLTGFGFTIVAARALPQEAFGVFVFIQALLWIGAMAVNPGVELAVVRLVGRERAQTTAVFSATLVVMLACGGATWLAITGLMLLGTYPPEVRALTILAAASFIAMALSQASIAMLKALERMAVFATVSAALSVAFAGTAVFVLAWGGGLTIIVGMMLCRAVLEAVVLLWLTARRHVPLVMRWNWPTIRTLVAQTAPVALLMGYLVIMNRADTLVLGAMRGMAEVGVYGSVTRIMDGFALLTTAMLGALVPRAAARWQDGRAASSRLYSQALVFFALLSLPIACVLTFQALPVLELLFGDDYQSGVPAMQLLAWSNVCMAIVTPAAALLIVDGTRMRLLLGVGAVLVALNLVLTVVLVGPLGATGAALATLLSSVANLIVCLYIVRSYMPARARVARSVGRPIVAVALMTAVFLVLHDAPALVAMASACLSYLIALLLLGEHREAHYAPVRAVVIRGLGQMLTALLRPAEASSRA